MTSHKQPAARLSEFAATLPGLIESLEVERLELERQMAALETLGLIYANPHWRDQKYLILLFPMQPGEARRRDYALARTRSRSRTRCRPSSGRRTTTSWRRAPSACRRPQPRAAHGCKARSVP